MGVDFTTNYPTDGSEPFDATCDHCGESMDLDHYGDMEEHTSKHREEQEKKSMGEIGVQSVPLMMGDKIIGTIALSLTDGVFSGKIVPEAVDILRDGTQGNVRAVTLQSIFGMAAKTDLTPQERWQAYLRS